MTKLSGRSVGFRVGPFEFARHHAHTLERPTGPGVPLTAMSKVLVAGGVYATYRWGMGGGVLPGVAALAAFTAALVVSAVAWLRGDHDAETVAADGGDRGGDAGLEDRVSRVAREVRQSYYSDRR